LLKLQKISRASLISSLPFRLIIHMMQYFNLLIFGLASLGSTVSANGKHNLNALSNTISCHLMDALP